VNTVGILNKYVLTTITGVSLADPSTCWGLCSKLGGKKPVGK
jgi:hypothetical protein